MPTPAFPPNTLDHEGAPIWISESAADEKHYTLHVVRGLEPAEALEMLGADPQLCQSDYSVCERAICALAGLTCTLDDVRRIPLILVPFH